MLEFEIAAVYYYVESLITAKAYFEEVAEGFETPCVFYPAPYPDTFGFSQNAYATEFVMYIKFMDHATLGAYEMGEKVLQAIMKGRRKIPLVDEEGKLTGKSFLVNAPKLKRVENGVYQMELSWKRYTRYTVKEVTMAHDIYMNSSPIRKEE